MGSQNFHPCTCRKAEPVWRHVTQRSYTNLPNRLLQTVLLNLDGTALKVYLLLYSWKNLGRAFAAREIARGLELSERTVQKALGRLAGLGLVERGERGWRAAEPGPAPDRGDIPDREPRFAGARTPVRTGANARSHPRAGEAGRKALQNNNSSPPPQGTKLKGEVGKKDPLSSASEKPTRSPREEEEGFGPTPEGKTPKEEGPSPSGNPPTNQSGHSAEDPETQSGAPGNSRPSPGLVQGFTSQPSSLPRASDGAVHVRRTLEGAGVWGEFARAFRPESRSPYAFGLWLKGLAPYLERLGLEGFLGVFRATLADLGRGGVYSPQRLFRWKLEEAVALAPSPPPPGPLTGNGAPDVRPVEWDPYGEWVRLSDGRTLAVGDRVRLPDGREGVVDEVSGPARRLSVAVGGHLLSVPMDRVVPLSPAPDPDQVGYPGGPPA